MGAWSSDSKTNVATMGQDDFRSNEQSVIIPVDDTLTIRHRATDGTVTDLKSGLKVLAGEVVDGTFISAKALDAFLVEQVARAKAEDVLFSVHLKATMMKVSDPIIFGHVVRAYFADVYAATARRCSPPVSTGATARPRSSTGSGPWRTARRSARPSSRHLPTDRAWRWSTPTGITNPTSPATSSSTPDARP